MTLAMSWDEWTRHDATALAGRVRSGEIRPAELAAQTAAAVTKLNAALDAVVEVFDDVVADPLRDGLDPDGFFAGVPYLMKDLGPTLKRRRQEMGSLLMQGNVAAADSHLTAKIRKAGLNIIGRSTTPEFGVCSSAENSLCVTRNPWNLGHTTCGSSAGSAAMVAAGATPISHGTDGGGSIRIPAGVNGLVGLKPSRGVFSIAPAGSDLSSVVSSQGCLTRTVRDTAAFVDHCRGAAPGEFMPYWKAEEPYAELIGRDPRPLRIALSHEWGPYGATPEIVAELERAGRFLEALGHHVDYALPAIDFAAAYAAQTTCYITNFAQTIALLLEPRGMERPPEGLIEPMNVRIWAAGIDATYAERTRMQLAFNAASRGFGAFFEDWDIILTPTMAKPTPAIGTTEYLTVSGNPDVRDWFHNLWGIFAYTPLSTSAASRACPYPSAACRTGCPWASSSRAARPMMDCCCNWPRRWSVRWKAVGTAAPCHRPM